MLCYRPLTARRRTLNLLARAALLALEPPSNGPSLDLGATSVAVARQYASTDGQVSIGPHS